MKKILLSALLLASFNALALVDYSTPVPAEAKVAPKTKSPSVPTESYSGRFFSLNAGYETVKVDYKETTQKANFYSLGGHFQTPYSIYLDASYWAAQSHLGALTNDGKVQGGNPLLKIGFNWLSFGGAQDLATFDMTAGLMFAGSKSSDFASSRFDKMIGVELTKRFYDFALQLGYELRLAGDPKESTETPVGNIHKITTSLGYRVSQDIRFALEGVMYKVGKNDLNLTNAALSKDIKFSYLSPKLSLGLSSSLDLEMGALYRTRRVVVQDDIVAARLWDLKGLYGNSVFANLIFSL